LDLNIKKDLYRSLNGSLKTIEYKQYMIVYSISKFKPLIYLV